MKISIKTIPHKQQHYNTVGDWRTVDDELQIRISNMGNKDFEFLVAIHELLEVYLCERKGITQEMVDEFDMSEYGKSLEDPGLDCKAPYHSEHLFALKIEEMLAEKLGVDWTNDSDYLKKMDELSESYDTGL